MTYKAKTPTAEQRKLVETMAAVGIPSDTIGRVIGVSGKTLRKHYRNELDLAATKANAEVAGFLFNSARRGNVAAQISARSSGDGIPVGRVVSSSPSWTP
jgi:hypothetical protein